MLQLFQYFLDKTYCEIHVTVPDGTLLRIEHNEDILYMKDNKFVRVKKDGRFYIHPATKKDEIAYQAESVYTAWTIRDEADPDLSGYCGDDNFIVNCGEENGKEKCVDESGIYYFYYYYLY